MANSIFKASFLWLNISRKANNSGFITYGDFSFIFMSKIYIQPDKSYTSCYQSRVFHKYIVHQVLFVMAIVCYTETITPLELKLLDLQSTKTFTTQRIQILFFFFQMQSAYIHYLQIIDLVFFVLLPFPFSFSHFVFDSL